MLQFIELRHNPVLVPKAGHPDPLAFDELIFIAAQKTYQLDSQFASAQQVETVVWRCLADEPGKRNLIASLALLLPETDKLRQHIELFGKADKPFRTKLRDVVGYITTLSSPEHDERLDKIQKALDATGYKPVALDDQGSQGYDEDDEEQHLSGFDPNRCVPFLIRSDRNAAEMADVQALQDLLNELGIEDALRALRRGKEGLRG